MKKYGKQIWLNKDKAQSTGSACAYFGKVRWSKKKQGYLEVGDCSAKIRLHTCEGESVKGYIKKLKKLRRFIDNFIEFLEKELLLLQEAKDEE